MTAAMGRGFECVSLYSCARGAPTILVSSTGKAATGFFHLEIVKSGQVPFLGRNTMFWPYFLHLGVRVVEIGRCTSS